MRDLSKPEQLALLQFRDKVFAILDLPETATTEDVIRLLTVLKN